MKHVKITTRPGAADYAQRGERIIEFSHPNGGGLISFFPTDNGRLDVSLYRLDSTVDVKTSYDDQRAPQQAPAAEEQHDREAAESTTLSWIYGDAQDVDQYADSAITAPAFGIRSASWHLSAIAPDAWAVTLRAMDGDDVALQGAATTLGMHFPTEQAA